MLEYENEMFLSALQEDGLTITAKGLGLENVFLSLLKVVMGQHRLPVLMMMNVISCGPGSDLTF